MADPISIAGAALSTISYAFTAFDLVRRLIQRTTGTFQVAVPGSSQPHIPILLRFIAPQLQPHLNSLNEVITTGSDEVFERFRTSYSFDCNMVAVAGAIIAQIAMTSLTLPYLSQTHWIARGFFILSVISGSLSVYFCVTTQKIIGTKYTPHEIRHWLTAPLPRGILPQLNHVERELAQLAELAEKAGVSSVNAEIAPHIEAGEFEQFRTTIMTKTPSILSVVVLSAPAFILNISLSALLIALGVYLGFIWTRNLDTDAGLHDSRNVLIFYVVGVFSMIAVYFVPNALKDSEDQHQAVRKRIVNLLEQVERKTGRPVPGSAGGLIAQDNDEVKVLRDLRVPGDQALGDMAKVLEKNVWAQEALLKANLELLAKIRGTSSGPSQPATKGSL